MHPWSLSVLPSSSVSTLTWNWPLNSNSERIHNAILTYFNFLGVEMLLARADLVIIDLSYKIPGFLNLSESLVTPSSVCIILCRGYTAVINWAVHTRHNSGLHFFRNFEYIFIRSSIKREKKRAIWKIWLETVRHFKISFAPSKSRDMRNSPVSSSNYG